VAGDEQGSGGGRGLYGSDVGANIVRASTGELIGTFILVFAGTAVAAAAALAKPIAGAAYGSLGVPLAFGFALVAIVTALGHVSGAHVNPAVTTGLAATGRFPWRLVPAYLAAQLAGAVLGALATWVTLGHAARSTAKLGATYPAGGVSDGRALLVEMLITAILVFVVMAVATDERVPAAAAGPAVGLALAVGVFIGGPATGGAVNPARALGPMLAAGKLTSFWLYIVGPLVGGVVAAFVYDRFVGEADAPES
jgi:MIP family channel proteins